MKRPTISAFIAPDSNATVPIPFVRAGQLVGINAGWRTMRPIVDHEQCVMCLQCYLLCPDGTIYKQDERIAVDYDFCKGCGVCANECPKKAIKMEQEEN